MLFIETRHHKAITTLLMDDAKELQSALMANPDAGDLIKGGGGIRKLRWGRRRRQTWRTAPYIWRREQDQILMLVAYPKSRKDNLTVKEATMLRDLVKELEYGQGTVKDLVQSLNEARSIVRGKKKTSRVFEVKTPDVKMIRERTGLSQTEFAQLLGVKLKTIQNWEQHRRQPTDPRCLADHCRVSRALSLARGLMSSSRRGLCVEGNDRRAV
jgi:putative transcriptional regulator